MSPLKEPIFTGTSTALITPFKNGSLDLDAVSGLIHMQKIAGIAAITVCGTTGEAVTMSDSEKASLIEHCTRNSDGMEIIAGTGTNDTGKTLEQSLAAQEAGADALLIVTPYYNKPTQDGLVRHFSYIADRVNIPIILYNVPSRTGVSLSPDACRALSGHPNINGIKYASSDLSALSNIIKKCGENLNVWSGNDDLTLPMIALGAKGCISVASNIIPREMVKLCELCLSGRFYEASKIHYELLPLMQSLFTVTNPIPIKTAASLMGLCGPQMRLPLCPMSEESERYLKRVLTEYKLI